MKRIGSRFADRFQLFSPGVWIILCLAVLSSIMVFIRSEERPTGLLFWTFARTHKVMYDPVVEGWNKRAESPDDQITIRLLAGDALQRRLMSGFLSGTPVPDLVEVYVQIASQAFKGPLDKVGFTDLTDLLDKNGLLEKINTPSFSPWMSRGRIFGLPHDVHPVLLAYRADITEAAGINMEAIETWEQFETELRPLMADVDDDGYPDRYLINLWETQPEWILALMQQAGGGLFDDRENPRLNADINVQVLAKIVAWTTGPNRIAVNAPEFDAAGNRMRLEGRVVCSLLPDWLSGAWQQDLAGLQGKVKVMPLPAWEPGGRRTSVMGGTMLGIPRQTVNMERAWHCATNLYFSKEIAHELFRVSGIVSPVKSFWSDPLYHEPNEFFSGQSIGSLYIEQAPHVPTRTSSPYLGLAIQKLGDAAMGLKTYVKSMPDVDADRVRLKAKEVLEKAQREVEKQMERNIFIHPEGRP